MENQELENKNEELHSRRDFFKEAAKKTLPLLGAVVVAGIPFKLQAKTNPLSCWGYCEGSCSSACGGSCRGHCIGNCEGSCDNTCDLTCTNSCYQGCLNSCYQGCSNSSYGFSNRW